MNEIKVFNSEQFGQVRTTTVDGEPLFVASDVCKALEINDTGKAVSRLDEDESTRIKIDHPQNPEKQLEVIAVNEAGLYGLVLGSRKPEAKAFKRWIKHDVLPSIRKHGMYATPQTIDNIINDPDFGIRLLMELKNERQKNSVLTAQNTELQEKIEADTPYTDFGVAISTSEGSITIKQLAALLCQRGMRTGEKRMFEELRQDGFLLTSGSYYNEPGQRWLDQKIFEVRTSNYTNKYGNQQIARQPLVTSKGIQYLMEYYMRKHDLMPMLSIHKKNAIVPRKGW